MYEASMCDILAENNINSNDNKQPGPLSEKNDDDLKVGTKSSDT